MGEIGSGRKPKTVRLGRRNGMPNAGSCKGGPNLLAAMIIVQAITDWRELVAKKDWKNEKQKRNKNLHELRQFFKSDWCEFLMMSMEITPKEILKKLESELQEAIEEEETMERVCEHNERN